MSELIRDINLAEQLAYAEEEIRKGEQKLKVVPELPKKIKESLSEMLHTEWLAGIRAQLEAAGQDSLTPRMRPTKNSSLDEKWFAIKEKDGIEFEVDTDGNRLINTNVPYEELSPSWQMANISAANFVTEGVVSAVEMHVNIESDEFIEAMASEIHEQWMEDNEWQRESNPELFVAYHLLPEEEKAKDRNQVLLAVEKIRDAKNADADARLAVISAVLGRMGRFGL